MMSAAFRELGLDWRYVKLPVPPELFAETVRALPASGYAGANVTIPHKLAARDAGRRAEPGRRGHRRGQHAELRRRSHQGRQHRRRRAARRARRSRWRAGARSCSGPGAPAGPPSWALREAGRGGGGVEPHPRARRRAGRRARRGPRGAPGPHRPARERDLGGPRGRTPRRTTRSRRSQLTGVAPPATVVDLVYGDAPTPLWRWASRGDGRVVGGLEVLVRQGALSLELWTGRDGPGRRHAPRRVAGRRSSRAGAAARLEAIFRP